MKTSTFTTNALARARRRKSGTRGTIMVESLIVLVIMIVAIAAGMLFYAIFATKLFTMRKAELDAWQAALPGCKGGGIGALIEAPAAAIDAASGDPEANPGLEIGAQVTSASESVDKYNLKSNVRVACNEIIEEHTDFITIVKWAIHEIVP